MLKMEFLAWQQERRLFLLEWLFYTTSTMQRWEQQCNRWRCPHLAQVAEDMVPKQPSVWALLGSRGEDILEVAEDIYHDQYQLASSTFSCWHLDLLMQELHDDLDQRLLRAGLHSNTSSGRSQSRGRACSHAPQWAHSSSWAQVPSLETSRKEGTTAPQQHRCSTVPASWVWSSGPVQSQECLYTSPRGEGWAPSHSPLRHGQGHRVDELLQPSRVPTGVDHYEATSIKRLWEGHWWGILPSFIDNHTAGAGNNSGVRAHCKEV